MAPALLRLIAQRDSSEGRSLTRPLKKKILEKNWIRYTNQNGREKITPSSKSIAQFKGAVDLSGALLG